MTRKLTSIKKIDNLSEIPNADKIEKATIGGWEIVVQKGLHSIGDNVLVFEIDSLLPEDLLKELNLWHETNNKGKLSGKMGNRLTTLKLRGQISQGMVIPLRDIKDYNVMGFERFSQLNLDTHFGITKYEPEIPFELQGEVLGANPTFFPMTEEERIQNIPQIFELYKDKEFIVHEKLDGTSMTIYYNLGHFGVCGRNWEYKENFNNTLWRIADKFRDKIPRAKFALSGELIGPGIQGNIYKLKECEFRPFSLYYPWRYDKEFATDHELNEICLELGLTPCPLVCKMKLPATMKELLEFADGPSLLNKDTNREGLVFRTVNSEYAQGVSIGNKNNLLSFKVISNLYLLSSK